MAFKLYDTYGFPIDLTRIISEERKFSVDESGFEKAMARQKEQSRKNWKGSGGEFTDEFFHKLKEQLKSIPSFEGYTDLAQDGTCLAIVAGDEEKTTVESFLNRGKKLA